MTLVHFAFASALAFFAPTRTSLLGQPVRPRSALLLQLDDSAPATNEEARMARMYKPGDEKDPLKKPRPKFGLAPATGRPKQVPLAHANLVASMTNIVDTYTLRYACGHARHITPSTRKPAPACKRGLKP